MTKRLAACGILVTLAAAVGLAGCATSRSDLPPVALVPHVDLRRYAGDWYVIATIATFIEKDALNEKESYRLADDGTMVTTFTFDKPDGTRKKYESRGFMMDDGANAVWGEQYVWPFKADYRISYLSPDYSEVVVTREKRDYVWIMARTPTISDADMARLTDFVGGQGYDIGKLRRVPQGAAS